MENALRSVRIITTRTLPVVLGVTLAAVAIMVTFSGDPSSVAILASDALTTDSGKICW
ncbi:hypothetical protein JNW90_25745 [Micromonospora sp. STR1s_5]|nr:hypothetical protein [Micromonospora sp. STR1s_5]